MPSSTCSHCTAMMSGAGIMALLWQTWRRRAASSPRDACVGPPGQHGWRRGWRRVGVGVSAWSCRRGCVWWVCLVYTGSVPGTATPRKGALNCLERVAVAFRKVGRPPEDRLCRQREIYLAVVPLLRCSGVRGLSMRAAARAAYVSVGALYYYFPTKRDLVLHGLQPEAIARYCHH